MGCYSSSIPCEKWRACKLVLPPKDLVFDSFLTLKCQKKCCSIYIFFNTLVVVKILKSVESDLLKRLSKKSTKEY